MSHNSEENGILRRLKKLLGTRIVIFTIDRRGTEGYLTRVEEDFIVLEERNGDLVEVEVGGATDPDTFNDTAETFTKLTVVVSKIVSFGRELPQNG